MSSSKKSNHKEDEGKKGLTTNKLNASEIQNMLKDVDMKQIQALINNIDADEIKRTINNIDFSQLAMIVKLITTLSKKN